MAEASSKAEPQEPSMEDILASIRRILAEDGSLIEADVADANARPELEEKTTAQSKAPASAASLAESLFDSPSAPPPPSDDLLAAPEKQDVFMLSPEMRVADQKLVSEQVAYDSTDVLSQLARAILDRRDIAVAARDVTLESMVREMLRPLLREWLDRNLPYLIERLVKKEIDLMINRAERLED
jgi:cell pole-organizing protein PopZ